MSAQSLVIRETEAHFQQRVVNLADLFGWWVYHTHDSRRSRPGFPDLVLVRFGQLIFAELKSERGRLTFEQEEWLRQLSKCAPTYVWRPSDWPDIAEILRAETVPGTRETRLLLEAL